MIAAADFPSNPRIFIGANGGPPHDDDKSPPTVEEARIVGAAICYLQWKVPNLEELLTKRKGGRILGWRLALVNCLKGRVRQNSLRVLLGFNRKTTGENQQRCDVWVEHDDEHGDGTLGDLVSGLRQAIEADSAVDAPALEGKLIHYVKLDPSLRALAERAKIHKAAAEEAEAAAAALRERKTKREKDTAHKKHVKRVKSLVDGLPNAEAIVARHITPERLAKTLSDEAIEVVEKLVVADMSGRRRYRSENVNGPDGTSMPALPVDALEECIRIGLARESIPHLAPRPEDPPIAPTDLGRRVFVEAEKLKRIRVKKRKAA